MAVLLFKMQQQQVKLFIGKIILQDRVDGQLHQMYLQQQLQYQQLNM